MGLLRRSGALMACLVLVGLAGYALVSNSLSDRLGQENLSTELPAYVTELKQGDFVFRRGKGRWSPFFASGNPMTGLSHVGVIEIVQYPEQYPDSYTLYVLHADADDDSFEGGVQRTRLDVFLQESEFYEFRRNHMTGDQQVAFMRALRTAWHDQVPFDTRFTLEDNGERFYCTEYVWWAAKVAGVRLAQPTRIMGVDVVTVDGIYASPLLSPLPGELKSAILVSDGV